jgi:peptidoglycan/LPS O-acetylase OafA/YrhL
VIINHFNKDILPSGYLGVDIFFVISGFVITSSLRRHQATSFQDFIIGFYARRLRRILPALLVMVLVVSFAITLVDPNPGTSLITGLASIFGLSNIYLVQRLTDYFAASADLNIFLHTWSLGIEEQFYFLFPLLAWWSGYGKGSPSGSQRLRRLLLPLLALSLVAFVVIYPRSQPHAYFLLSSRFWELASGCLISLLPVSKLSAIALQLPALPLLGGLLGLLFLPLTQAVPATLLCIALTSLLIYCLRRETPTHALLSWRPIVSIGLLSYSLYLWHWPVLALSRWTVGIHRETIPLQLLLISGLAWLSYRFVERPLRNSPWPSTRGGTILVALLASLTGSLIIMLLAKGWKEQLFLGQRNDLEKTHSVLSHPGGPVCNIFDDPTAPKEFPERCGFNGSPKRPTIYMVGDSQIEQFAPAISAFAREHNLSFRGLWGNACAFPALEGVKGSQAGRSMTEPCQKAQRATEKALLARVTPGDVIFIGSYLTNYFHTDTTDSSEHSQPSKPREEYLKRLILLSEKLIANGATVVIYLNGPRFDGLEGAVDGYCFPQWFKPNLDSNCQISSAPFGAQRQAKFRALYAWADGSQRLLWDGLDQQTCHGAICQATHYKDEAHFREYYANYLFGLFVGENPGLLAAHNTNPGREKTSPGGN